MPILFQHTINNQAKLSLWKIEEPESFFADQLPVIPLPSHAQKRLQHLAGRFLLKYLAPDFPVEKIIAAPGTKPYVPEHGQEFSISHSGFVAAAIISDEHRAGIDVEMISEKASRIAHKFLQEDEMILLNTGPESGNNHCTLAWSIKETIFKWYGQGQVDFREDIQIKKIHTDHTENRADCFFRKTGQILQVKFIRRDNVVLSWLI